MASNATQRARPLLSLGQIVATPDALELLERFGVSLLIDADFVLAQRRGHPRGPGIADLDEYCRLAHAIVSDCAAFWTPVDDELEKLSRRRTVAAAVPSYHQVAQVLAATDCVAIVPRPLLRRLEGVIEAVDLPFDLPRFRLAMAWHPRAQEDKAVGWLRDRFLAVRID